MAAGGWRGEMRKTAHRFRSSYGTNENTMELDIMGV
jgi:hypothetical protein